MTEPTAREVEMERVLVALKTWLEGLLETAQPWSIVILRNRIAEIDAALNKD